jgi:hypothetical protein
MKGTKITMVLSPTNLTENAPLKEGGAGGVKAFSHEVSFSLVYSQAA